jgi:hypothetical protein
VLVSSEEITIVPSRWPIASAADAANLSVSSAVSPDSRSTMLELADELLLRKETNDTKLSTGR